MGGGESRGRGPVWERGTKTPTSTVSVIISKPQLADSASSAFISNLRLVWFFYASSAKQRPCVRVRARVCVCVSVFLLDHCRHVFVPRVQRDIALADCAFLFLFRGAKVGDEFTLTRKLCLDVCWTRPRSNNVDFTTLQTLRACVHDSARLHRPSSEQNASLATQLGPYMSI